ncbi:MAG: TIGR00282 family metallophosphoesterase [bacterium]
MKILFIGDVNGKVGRRVLDHHLPALRREHEADLCVVNGENAAGGFGITSQIAEDFFQAGADVITSGNHIWRRKEVGDLLLREPRLLRPANYPAGVPGSGVFVQKTPAGPVAVVNLMGRLFMPPVECPFRAADRILADLGAEARVILVDFHAEATSEKVALGWHLDGRVSALLGTHTHIQTADERVLPGGTAYLSDAGMTGPADSVIGVEVRPALERFLTGVQRRVDPGGGEGQLNGVLIEADADSGRALSIERIAFRESDRKG